MMYIGYTTLEKMAREMNILKPVYVEILAEQQNQMLITKRVDVITVSQIDGDIVHYMRMPTAVTQWDGNECLTPEGLKRLDHALAAFALIKGWLIDAGFQIHEGMVALPTNLQYLEGRPEFLNFKRDRGFYMISAGGANEKS